MNFLYLRPASCDHRQTHGFDGEVLGVREVYFACQREHTSVSRVLRFGEGQKWEGSPICLLFLRRDEGGRVMASCALTLGVSSQEGLVNVGLCVVRSVLGRVKRGVQVKDWVR